MSELTREKKCQVAALGAKGKTVEEIAQTAGIEVETVREFLSGRESSEKKPLFGGNKKITTKTIAKINELRSQGKTHKEIADELGIGTATVNRYLHKDKPSQINEDFDKAVDEMIAEAETKKEPAPAATDTSSTNENINSLYPNDTIDEPKSQPLSGISGSNNIEAALEEWLGNEKEIVYLKADTESAEVRFKCDGRVYSMTFRRYA
jgi:hypothetical protein